MRGLLVAFLIVIIGAAPVPVVGAGPVPARLVVDGRQAFWNRQTNTFLATMPRTAFNNTVTVSIQHDASLKAFSLEGLTETDSLVITDLTSETAIPLCYEDSTGQTVDGFLQFTFLPIVQLQGEFGYDYQEGTVLLSCPDSLKTDTLSARIKWRGGITNTNDKHKRNYKIKLSEDHKLLGLRNDNNWMLDAGQPDVFRMRNRIAMDLWNRMARKPYYADQKPNARNGVRGRMVEVFLNDEWRGIYNFSEMMDRKQLNLKRMDEETGEIHGCLYKGVSWDKTMMYDFFDSYDNTKDTFYGYEMKYPDLDDSDTLDWAPLVAANNFARSSTDEEFQQQVDDYFDIPVLIDYNIFFNVVNAVDNTGKNMYWAIYDKTTTKCLTPTPWDLDATFGQRWGGKLTYEVEEGFCNSPEFRLDFELSLTYRFFRDNFNDYVGRMNERYKQLRQPGQPLHTDSILAIVDQYYYVVKNSGAAAREEAKWSGDSDVWGDIIDFDTEYAYICDWVRQRMEFIDWTELPLFYKSSYFAMLGINMPVASTTDSHHVYTLTGQDVSSGKHLRPGIYIKAGRKVVIR